MSSYFLVNKETKTLEYYNDISLYCKYLFEGFIEMSDIKEVGNIDFLLEALRFRGVLIFEVSKINNAESYKIKMVSGASETILDNVQSAMSYCREKGLSAAADSYIKTALVKNLTGKTKSAYGKTWSFIVDPLDLSDYKIEVII